MSEDARAAIWRRAIGEHSESLGVTLAVDVVEELIAYVEDVYDASRRDGASDEEAMAIAQRAIDQAGYEELAPRQRTRAADSRLLFRASPPAANQRRSHGAWMADLAFDLRYAFRAMRRRPAFSGAIIAILAIGIGAAMAAYAVIDTVLLRPLPYPASDRLVALSHGGASQESHSFAAADWRDYATRARTLAGLAAWSSWPMNLSGSGEPERLRSFIVSGEFFGVLGVQPALGRLPTADDDRPGAPAVAVLSDGFWRRRFGGRTDAVGTVISLNGQPVTIVGVLPASFAYPDAHADLWTPMALPPAVLQDRAGEWLSLIGRVPPDATLETSRAELSAIAGQLAPLHPRPQTSDDARIGVTPLVDVVVGSVRRPLWLGGLAALLVLLAGLANAANLMLAAATTRQDEMAIRAGLGADGHRLARQLLTETLALAGASSLLGGLLSSIFLRAFVVFAADRIPRVDALSIRPSLIVAGVLLCLLSVVIVGAAAAWRLVRAGTQPLLHGSPQRIVRAVATQEIFLAVQVAFALVLIAGETDIASSYARTMRIDPGFDTSNTVTVQLTLPRRRYADNPAHQRFAQRAIDAVAAQPGVTSAGVVSDLPFVANATHFAITRSGQPSATARLTTVRIADPGFFHTLRIPLIAGRTFDSSDRADAPPVVMLNASAARFYGGATAIVGERLNVAGGHDYTVVGIVGDIKHAGLHADEGPVVYIPYAQKPFDFLNWMGLVVRTTSQPLSAASLKSAIASVDPTQPVEAILSMEDYLHRETAPYRFGSLIIGSLAATAFLLALAGVHAIAAFVVNRRSRDLALRLALGATPQAITRTAVSRLAFVVLTGVLLGVATTLSTRHLLLAALPESAPTSIPLISATALIACLATLAALTPPLRLIRHLHRNGLHLNQD